MLNNLFDCMCACLVHSHISTNPHKHSLPLIEDQTSLTHSLNQSLTYLHTLPHIHTRPHHNSITASATPKAPEETEMLNNLFDCMCACLMRSHTHKPAQTLFCSFLDTKHRLFNQSINRSLTYTPTHTSTPTHTKPVLPPARPQDSGGDRDAQQPV